MALSYFVHQEWIIYCKLVTVTDVRAERQPLRAKVLANVNTQPE